MNTFTSTKPLILVIFGVLASGVISGQNELLGAAAAAQPFAAKVTSPWYVFLLILIGMFAIIAVFGFLVTSKTNELGEWIKPEDTFEYDEEE